MLHDNHCLLCHFVGNSIKAGHLLPYLQYQLYSKQKGPLFPGMNLRQTFEIPGPSHGVLQPTVHQKLHLPQRSTQHSILNQEQSSSSCQKTSIRNQLYQGNSHLQSIQQSPVARFINPPPSQLTSTHPSPGQNHLSSSSHTHLLSNSSSMKPPQTSIIAHHSSLQHQTSGQPQPQITSSYNTHQSGCKEVQLRL